MHRISIVVVAFIAFLNSALAETATIVDDLPDRFTPVSAASYGDSRFLVADYKRIYLVSEKTNGRWILKEVPIIFP